MAGIVVVFDFDKTIIDCDSNQWLMNELGVNDMFMELLPTLPWTTLMDRMMLELHSRGKTVEDIMDCLKRIPLHPNFISAIKSAHALGCELRIVSDANLFLIKTILKHHGLMDCFSEISTNPSVVDQGRLRVFPYHDFTISPHGCPVCPPNLCKSIAMERTKIFAQAQVNTDTRIVFVGDGEGDFCPSTKLRDEDYVMPRKNFPLSELILSSPLLIKAMVREWSNWNDLESVLLGIINKTILDVSSASCVSGDCVSCDSTGHTTRMVTKIVA